MKGYLFSLGEILVGGELMFIFMYEEVMQVLEKFMIRHKMRREGSVLNGLK
jgi:hypothetical protein